MFQYTGIYEQLRQIASSYQGVTGNDYNLILTIPQSSGEAIIDPVTGNYTLPNTTNLILQIKAKPVKPPQEEINTGQDYNRTYLLGHLVNPLNYSGDFPTQVSAQLIQNGITENGKFTAKDNIPSSLVESFEMRRALGEKIYGYFEKVFP